MTRPHRDAIGIHKGAYAQDSDPGAVGAHKLWVDTTGGVPPYPMKLRNADNTDWEDVGSAGGFSNPMTTQGDLMIENATPAADRLPYDTDGAMLVGASGMPAWADPATFLAAILAALNYVAKDGGTGHVGIVSAESADWTLDVEETVGALSNPGGAIRSVITKSAGDFEQVYGAIHYGLATNGSGTQGQVVGVHGEAGGSGAGTLLNAVAVEAQVVANGKPITHGYGVYVNSPTAFAGGVITNDYGVYVDDQSGSGITNNWGVYSVSKVNTDAAYYASGTKVLGSQGAAVADATGSGDVVAQLNALLARLRAHGVIAT